MAEICESFLFELQIMKIDLKYLYYKIDQPIKIEHANSQARCVNMSSIVNRFIDLEDRCDFCYQLVPFPHWNACGHSLFPAF
jgi:hypothetical protein